MPIVLVHGVPDTVRVWEPLRLALHRKDVLPLELPQFDIPAPADFPSTKEAYVTFIADRLREFNEPVDLVGHDWGGILTARIASLYPSLIRSWAAGDGPVSSSYEWHPLAKTFQTPGEGERFMENLDPTQLANSMAQEGLSLEIALAIAKRIDDRMKSAILTLYRSATQVGNEWQPDLRNITSPGFVFWGARDKACSVAFAQQLADDTCSSSLKILDAGHWSIVERSKELAKALEKFWFSLE